MIKKRNDKNILFKSKSKLLFFDIIGLHSMESEPIEISNVPRAALFYLFFFFPLTFLSPPFFSEKNYFHFSEGTRGSL